MANDDKSAHFEANLELQQLRMVNEIDVLDILSNSKG